MKFREAIWAGWKGIARRRRVAHRASPGTDGVLSYFHEGLLNSGSRSPIRSSPPFVSGEASIPGSGNGCGPLVGGGALGNTIRTYRHNHVVVRRSCRHTLVRVASSVKQGGIQWGGTLSAGGRSPVDVIARDPGGDAGGPVISVFAVFLQLSRQAKIAFVYPFFEPDPKKKEPNFVTTVQFVLFFKNFFVKKLG